MSVASLQNSAAFPTALVSAADSAAARPSRTLRTYLRTLAWTLGAVNVCLALYAIEKWVLIPRGWLPNDTHYRMFKNPSELPMRLFGLPHFVIGTLFLLTSRRMRGARSMVWLAGLTAVGVAFCVLFHRYGAHTNPLAMLLFYFYFLIHGFRDEAFFYRCYGEMPTEAEATHRRIMLVLQITLLGLLMSMLIPAYVLYGQIKPRYNHPALDAVFPASWPYTLRFASMMGPMILVTIVALRRIARVFPDGLAGLWRTHRPMLMIFLISSGIILLSIVSGPWSFNIVVLMHFVGWYFFGRWQLSTRPAAASGGPWTWMRSTVNGFTVMHLGLAVVVTILAAVSTYAFGKEGMLEAAVGSKSFFYWTILHVTLSFFPR